jgi:hypothetical protein
VGENRRTDVPNSLVQGEKASVVSTIVGIEKLLSVDTVKVHVHMSIHPDVSAEDINNVIVDGYYNVDPLAGKLMHSEYTMSNVPVPIPDGAGVMRVVVKRDYEPMNRLRVSINRN